MLRQSLEVITWFINSHMCTYKPAILRQQETDCYKLFCGCHCSGRERHNAAFELINLALTDDDNKFHIVQEGG